MNRKVIKQLNSFQRNQIMMDRSNNWSMECSKWEFSIAEWRQHHMHMPADMCQGPDTTTRVNTVELLPGFKQQNKNETKMFERFRRGCGAANY